MDDRRFDSVAKAAANGTSRRSLLKAILGIGSVAATGAVIHNRADAARRGFSGPKIPWEATPIPTPTPVCLPDGDFCFIWEPETCCSGICIFNPLSPTSGYCVP